jgi:hypothetical protein
MSYIPASYQNLKKHPNSGPICNSPELSRNRPADDYTPFTANEFRGEGRFRSACGAPASTARALAQLFYTAYADLRNALELSALELSAAAHGSRLMQPSANIVAPESVGASFRRDRSPHQWTPLVRKGAACAERHADHDPVWSKNSMNPSCPATVFNVNGIPDWGVPLLSANSWIARRCNPSPDKSGIRD